MWWWQPWSTRGTCHADFAGDIVGYRRNALSLASENLQKHELHSRVDIAQGDLLEPIASSCVDVVLANPPYVDSLEMASLEAEYQHEPRQALAAGADGLDLIPTLIEGAARVLHNHGLLVLEVGNSWHALESQFPRYDFMWVDLEWGGRAWLSLAFGLTSPTGDDACINRGS